MLWTLPHTDIQRLSASISRPRGMLNGPSRKLFLSVSGLYFIFVFLQVYVMRLVLLLALSNLEQFW